MREITVVLADDHPVVRKGLRLMLDHQAGLRVVGEAGTVPETLRVTQAECPTVLVFDLNMPGGSSLAALEWLRTHAPTTAIVILTMHDDPAFARRALQAGALGFVLKEAANEQLLEAIRAAAGGQAYLDPHVGARLAAAPEAPPVELSTREFEILRLIALGHTNEEIAQQLFLSTRTVESHRAHIQRKLGQRSRAGLVRYALDHGVLAV
jgi:two-component system response regulator NreC